MGQKQALGPGEGGGAFSSSPTTTAGISFLSFPILLTGRVPSQPVGNVCAAFMAVLICRPPRGGWEAASSRQPLRSDGKPPPL